MLVTDVNIGIVCIPQYILWTFLDENYSVIKNKNNENYFLRKTNPIFAPLFEANRANERFT